ncbi:RNA polymerase sigma factor [Nordella sp. HKS 07]|uniref:RNA polymerase sigma factor n=1 Tax=Nordella sp. HKS 07 TaxID=2712222 RepID=UPI0013E159C0|nr:RNA polymerase sigma factor [Nordella sp. HKS 07]QIG47313.1 RNA polymerase sigma factor [Nordella sp. HKS 07]
MSETHHAIDAIWRIEQAKLIAGLTRFTRDIGQAEELAQEALLTALEQWPKSGIPEKPGAWLMAAAKNRAIDRIRKAKLAETKHAEIGRARDAEQEEALQELEAALDDPVGDDLLRLIFISCHPVLTSDARTALTLRLIGGLTTDEIARAYLQTEATVAQRIVRAKRTLADRKVPFELPRGAELMARRDSVIEVLYLIFNEGYSATNGEDWMRPQLCEEALRLSRILAGLMPGEAEVHGLVALMEIQASRLHARTGPDGEPILLLEQNRALWDQLLIRRGLAALAQAEALTSAPGRYGIQAAIAACHARAARAADTDWNRIAALYDLLAAREDSPVVELNRAVAHSMKSGPQTGLDLLDALLGEEALKAYYLLPSVRGDFLVKLGRHAEAETEFRRAAALTQNARERSLLLQRADACRQS